MTTSTVRTGAAIFVLGILAGWYFLGDTNGAPTYGATGAPKNCRALIAANIDGWRSKVYTADAVLNSLDVHCGRNGSHLGPVSTPRGSNDPPR